MREIKFRAWHKKNKKMIDLKKLTPLALANGMADKDGLFIPFSDSLILMQFTGLLDRNGNEIYEGDIIESKKMTYSDSGHFIGLSDVLGTVVFTNGRFALHLIDGALPDLHFGSNDHVVKGNKFEHPELLEAK